MNKEKSLVLILGAGASKEVGLPTGEELKTQIVSLFRSNKADFFYENLGCPNNIDRDQSNDVIEHIRDALPQANSIDDFINANADKPAITLFSKYAISSLIIHAERKSILCGSKYNEFTSFDLTKSSETWFSNFFKILIENCPLLDLPYRLQSVGIINFNYDRCVEHFLFNAIRNYYRIESHKTTELMRNMDIHHPYGLIDKLPWMDAEDSTAFGCPARSDEQIYKSINAIRTFSESTEQDSPRIEKIRTMVNHGSRLVFLGFAFHRINMELLFGKEWGRGARKRTYASGYGLSNSNCEAIKGKIEHSSNAPPNGVQIRNDLTCAKLIQEYRHSLSLN